MASERKLTWRIIGDASSGKKAISEAESSLGKFGVAGDKAHSALSKVTGKLDSFGPIGQKASSTLNGMVGGLGAIPVPAVAAGAAVGAIAVGIEKMAVSGIAKFQSLAGEVKQFARVSGAGAEEASRFVALGNRYGVAADTMSSAVFKLGINVEKHKDKLHAAGIEVEKNADGTTNLTGTLLNVSEAYNRTDDPAKKAGIAFAAFGKAGASLLPILSKTRGEIDGVWAAASRHHEILTDADLKKAAEYKKAQYELGQAFGGLERELGSGLIPLLTKYATSTTVVIENVDKLANKVGGLENVFDVAARAIPGVGQVLGVAGFAMDLFGEKSDDAAGGAKNAGDAASDAAPDVAGLGEAAGEIVDPADAAKAALSSLSDAFDRFIGVNVSAETADIRFRDALEAVTASVKQHGVTLDINSDAGRRNREAIDSVITASTSHIQAMAQAGASAGQLTAQWNTEKNALLDKLKALGLNAAEIAVYKAQLDSIPASKFTEISANLQTANAKKDWQDFLNNLKNRLDLTVNIHRVGPAVASMIADGAVFPTVTAYASGGENHVAQIARPGEWRVWAEPETGGEAYIPLSPSKRSRSTAILEDVAQRFGMQLMANGGGAAGFANAAVASGGGVNVFLTLPGTVYATGGERQLAALLVDHIHSELLKKLARNSTLKLS